MALPGYWLAVYLIELPYFGRWALRSSLSPFVFAVRDSTLLLVTVLLVAHSFLQYCEYHSHFFRRNTQFFGFILLGLIYIFIGTGYEGMPPSCQIIAVSAWLCLPIRVGCCVPACALIALCSVEA
jgi:hypothetical protein